MHATRLPAMFGRSRRRAVRGAVAPERQASLRISTMRQESDDHDVMPGGAGHGALSLRELQSVFTQMRADLVRFLTHRTGNAETAQDLSHDVYEKLPEIRAEIPTVQKARSYFIRMAGNLAIDHYRIEERRQEILSGSEILFEDADIGPDSIATWRDELRQIEMALEELPEICQQVLVLARVQGLPHKEVARRLGISVSSVEKHQLRALQHCRARLTPGG